MFFRKKDKTPKNFKIDELKFLSDEAKNAFNILEITETSQLVGKREIISISTTASRAVMLPIRLFSMK